MGAPLRVPKGSGDLGVLVLFVPAFSGRVSVDLCFCF